MPSFCSKCGLTLEPNARFCEECGTQVSRVSTYPLWFRRRTVLFPAALLVSVAGLIVIVVFAGLKRGTDENLSPSSPPGGGQPASSRTLPEESPGELPSVLVLEPKEKVPSGLAPTSTGLIVSLSQPRVSASGAVSLYFSVKDPGGQPVSRLGPEDIEVWQDGTKTKILDFRGEEQSRPIDIVVVFDVTESMGPFIEGMKEATIAFADRLAKANRDYRLGLVTFQDQVVRQTRVFTRSAREFKRWIGALQAAGGGDIPENSLDALKTASRFPFRSKTQPVAILITDAPNHFRGDGSEKNNPYGREVTQLTANEVIAELKKANINVFAIVPPHFVAPDLHKIAQATGGRHYNIVSEGRHFPELIGEISHSLASQYFLTYQSPRPTPGSAERRITLKVTARSGGGEASLVYHAGDENAVAKVDTSRLRAARPPRMPTTVVAERKRLAEETKRLALIQERSKKPLDLISVRFFNTTKDGKQLSSPSDSFTASQLRFVTWNAIFRNKLYGLAPAYHRVEATYYAPNGRPLGTVQDAKEVLAKMREVSFTGRIGNSSGGAFVPGTYRVDFSVNGWPISSVQFTVNEDRTLAPALHRHSGSILGLVGDREVSIEIRFDPQGDGRLGGEIDIRATGYGRTSLEGRIEGLHVEFESRIGRKLYQFRGWREADRLRGTYKVPATGQSGHWSVKITGGTLS